MLSIAFSTEFLFQLVRRLIEKQMDATYHAALKKSNIRSFGDIPAFVPSIAVIRDYEIRLVIVLIDGMLNGQSDKSRSGGALCISLVVRSVVLDEFVAFQKTIQRGNDLFRIHEQKKSQRPARLPFAHQKI